MEELLARIIKITDTPWVNFAHLVEECGELSTELLIYHGQSYKESEEGVLAEAVDAIISALAIMANVEPDPARLQARLLQQMDKKISKWEKNRVQLV